MPYTVQNPYINREFQKGHLTNIKQKNYFANVANNEIFRNKN